MKFKINSLPIVESNGRYGFYCVIPNNMLDKFNKLKDKVCSVEVKEYREKRSLNANSYAFKLMGEIGKKLTSTTEEVYEQMLRRYGVHDYCVVVADAIPTLKKAFKYVDVMNKVQVNGKNGVQVKCILGSSNYDSLQMSKFIEGIKTECCTLGIETLTPDEIKRMVDNYES